MNPNIHVDFLSFIHGLDIQFNRSFTIDISRDFRSLQRMRRYSAGSRLDMFVLLAGLALCIIVEAARGSAEAVPYRLDVGKSELNDLSKRIAQVSAMQSVFLSLSLALIIICLTSNISVSHQTSYKKAFSNLPSLPTRY